MKADKEILGLVAQMRNMLDSLELKLGVSQGNDRPSKQVQKPRADYSGPSGGVRLLLDEDFFKTPKAVSAVESRLRQEGRHYRQSVVAMALLRAVRKRLLTRLPSGGKKGQWSYVERK
ncbi:hypothetical protein DRH29_00055 [candidate division Kazan bacterium]|uniref:Uncharacterized protein n=1 Tax=candidate division Kazan bacterium TaxID=2202143 RepID=A0A420ZDP5_UNCK3|nr:MAG: hypothetical protein DRH29_00055 [candidate division Kazan bacterium]